ncbi:hypothetical protein FDP22_12645 [Paroceanicella profunda]|uniref:LamG domain-containing protein n=1 Tax=Paroceanicella profunda TaxID=2579971 RepID=A0A5B8FUW7_9RHOB|nr:hypothetical protein [Paroceanicella profunda]QDL92556.1 hypothetical protein FDP22_12645 [Paroceanicella profunda]
MIITLKDVSFAGAGLGTATELIRGIPKAGLLGLYMMDEAEIGAPVSSLADISGNGNTATLRSGWTAPIQRDYGLEVAGPHGTVFRTPIPTNPSGRKRTMYMVQTPLLPGNEASVYSYLFGASGNGGMALPTDNHTNAPFPALRYYGIGASGIYDVYDLALDILGATTVKYSAPPTFGEPSLASFSYDGAAPRIEMNVQSGDTRFSTNAAIGTFLDGTTDYGTIEFGIWGHQVARSAANPLGRMHMVAIYETFYDTAAQLKHMAFMAKAMQARSVVV